MSAAFLGLALNSCSIPASTMAVESSQGLKDIAKVSESVHPGGAKIWSSGFDADWRQRWRVRKTGSWGLQNTEIVSDSGKFPKVLRVHYPAGSGSPNAFRRDGATLGGCQYYADLGMPSRDILRLSYYVRFSDNFDFVKGGKLPGLFGGEGNSGGEIPDGTDGFSTRFMWRRNGDGEVYAYLPTSTKYGTSIGRGAWRFRPGKWYHLEQEVVLNQPNSNDGRVRVWVDGVQVLDQHGITFRTTKALKIEGIFFSTFFGGADASWATPRDVYADFAGFSLTAVN